MASDSILKGQVFKALGVRATFERARSSIPIHLGVMAPKALALAGEIADGVLLNSIVSPEFIRHACRQIQGGAERSGKKLEDFSMGAYLTLAMSRDERDARNAVKPYIAMIIGALGLQLKLPIFAQAGITPEAAERFTQGLIRGEVAAHIVSETMIDVLAIAGSPERCRERLAEVVEAGVRSPTIFFPPQTDFAQAALNVAHHLFPYFL